MAESELAQWAADISNKPYGERIYKFSCAVANQTLMRILDILSLIHISEPTRPY